jgi:hypothetical protein
MTKDLHNLTSLYESVLIKEQQANSLPQEVKQKIDAFLNSDEGKKFLLSVNKTASQIDQIAKKNPKDASQLSESVINEALPSQWISKAAGWKRAIQGQRVGDTGEKLDVQSHQVNKRFEILQKKLGSHLKELQRDLSTTSQADDTVKKEVDQMIASLESEHSIKPTESKFQDIRHGVGRGVEWAGKAAALGGIGALLGGAVSSLAGVVGIPALAIKGAVAAVTRKVAADLLKGQKPNTKQVLIQSLMGAGAGVVFGLAAPLLTQYKNEIFDYVFGLTEVDNLSPDYSSMDKEFLNSPEANYTGIDQTPDVPGSPDVPVAGPSTADIQNSVKADWPKLSRNIFGREGLEGSISNLSKNDNTALEKITQVIKDKNLDWSKLSLKQKAALFDPIAKQVLGKK